MQQREANRQRDRVPGGVSRDWHPPAADTCGDRIRDAWRRARLRQWPLLLCVLFCLPVATPSAAAEEDVRPEQVQSGSLLLRMKSGYVIATRMNTDIEADVSGLAARVRVRQVFRNDGSEWVEGVYVFPLPDSAAVDRLRMEIGERIIEGEIREKEAAKKAYTEAKEAGKKASLVEQQRANLFTTSVANIAPGESVTIEIAYLETLKYDGGNFSLRFPLTLTPRFIPGTPLPGRKGSGWSADTSEVHDASLITPPVVTRSGDHRVTFVANLDAGVPLRYVASRYHPVDVTNDANRYRISLSERDVPMDHDLELTWKPATGSAPKASVFVETVGGEPHVLLMVLPPDVGADAAAVMPRELVFVIDTSGSMHGTSLEQAKRALTLALDGLRPTDHFNVIQFNSVTSTLFPSSAAASPRNVSVAKSYVASLKANGGTVMRPALERALKTPAYESHLRQVIFITDGSVGNEDDLARLIEANLGSARLFTVGIGSAPNGWFMRKAAEAGRGTFTTISALHEVNEKMGRLFHKLEAPQVTDIDVDWPGAGGVEPYPAKVPDLYAGEPVFVRARLSQPARPGDVVRVRGDSAAGTWSSELRIAAGENAPGIGALWARARIEALQDDARRGADADATRKAIIDTALAHHLVSKYTSLVAVDKTPVRPAGTHLSKEQVPNLLPYGQSHRAIFGFPATATPAPLQRLIGLLLIAAGLAAIAVARRRARHAEAEPA